MYTANLHAVLIFISCPGTSDSLCSSNKSSLHVVALGIAPYFTYLREERKQMGANIDFIDMGRRISEAGRGRVGP